MQLDVAKDRGASKYHACSLRPRSGRWHAARPSPDQGYDAAHCRDAKRNSGLDFDLARLDDRLLGDFDLKHAVLGDSFDVLGVGGIGHCETPIEGSA